MATSYNLFLDDERSPGQIFWVHLPLVPWRIVRTYKDFVGMINKEGLPKIISFDNDLADEHYQAYIKYKQTGLNIDNLKFTEKTGYDCACFVVDYCLNNRLDLPEYYVHSMNPVGKSNIVQTLERGREYLREKL